MENWFGYLYKICMIYLLFKGDCEILIKSRMFFELEIGRYVLKV